MCDLLDFVEPVLCLQSHDHVSGHCRIPEGSGSGFVVLVATLHQSSLPLRDEAGLNVTFNYDAPVILSVVGTEPAVGMLVAFVPLFKLTSS